MARSLSTAYAIQNAAFMQNEEEYVNQYNLNRFFPQAHEEYRGREIRFLDQTFAPPMNLDQLAFHNLSAESQSSSSSSSSPSSDRSTPLVGPLPFHPSYQQSQFQPLQHFQPIPHFVSQPSPAFQRPSNIVVMGPNGPINPNTRLTSSSSHCPSPSYSNYGGGGQSTTPKFAPSALRHAAAAAAAAANAAAAAAAAANHKPKPSLQRANSLSRLQGRKKSPAARPSSSTVGAPAHYGSQYEHGPDSSNLSHLAFRPSQLGANQPCSIQFISNRPGSNTTLFDAPKKRFVKSFTDLQLQNSLNRNDALAHSTPNLASAPKYFCAPDFDVSLKPANYPQALLLPNQAHQQPIISRSQYHNYSQSSSSSFDDEAPLDLSGPAPIKPNKQQQFYRSNPDISISLVDAPKVKRQPQPKPKPQSQPKLQPQPKPQPQSKLQPQPKLPPQPQPQPQQLEGLANHLSCYRSPSPSPSHFVARIQKQKQAMEKLAKQSSALASASTPVRILANDIVPGTTRQPPDVLRQRLNGATSSPSTSAAAASASHDQNLIPALIVPDNPISNPIINSKSSQTTNKVIAKTVSIPKEFSTPSNNSSTVNKGPGHTHHSHSPPIHNVQMLSETRIKIISDRASPPSQQQTIISATSAESNLESQASGTQSMGNELAEPKDKSQEGNKRKNKGKFHHHRKASATSPKATTPSAPTSPEPTEALPKVRINVKTNRIIPCGSPTSSTSSTAANEAMAASPPTSQAAIEPKGANQEMQKDTPSIVAMETDGGESVVAISPSSSSSVSELPVAMPANRTAPATNPFESLVAVAARLAETDQHQTSARQNSGLNELTNREEQAAIELLNLRTVAITSTSNTVTTASQTDSSVPLIPHCTLLVMANPPTVGVNSNSSSTGATKTPELIVISDDDNDSIHEKQDVTGNDSNEQEQQQQLNAVAQPIVSIDQQQPVGINQQQPKFADCNIDPIEANNVNDDNLPADLPADLPANLPQSHEEHQGVGEFLPFTTNVDHNEPLVVLHGENLPSVMSYYDEVKKVTKHFFLIAKKDERHNIHWMQTQLGNGDGSAPVRVVPTMDACKIVRVFDESAIVTISDSEDDDESAAPEPQSAKRKRGRPLKGGSRVKSSTASTSAQPVGPPLKRMRDA